MEIKDKSATREDGSESALRAAVALGGEGFGSAPSDLAGLAELMVSQARTDGVALTGPGGLLTGFAQQVLQTALELEMSEHLGYERHERTAGQLDRNSRNGSTPKTVRTGLGDVRIQVPRDRVGSFAPVVVPKHARRLEGFDAAVISLYARGMTTGDITSFLADT